MRIILDIPILLSDVLSSIDAFDPDVNDGRLIYAVCTDSRECEVGDLFFSLAAEWNNRIKNARDAAGRGAICICDSRDFIFVPDVEKALLRLSALYKSHLPRLSHTVGITGSVGKSTCKRFVLDVLSNSFAVSGTIGNFNNRIGISLSILSAGRSTEVLVLEMGMNHKGEIREMARVICPDVCVITNVGTAHIGNLGSREAIRDAKCEIINPLTTTVIVPNDEPLLKDVDRRIGISLSSGDELKADCFENATLARNGTEYQFCFNGKIIHGIQPRSKTRRDLYALLISGVIAEISGMSEEDIKNALNKVGNTSAKEHIIPLGDITVIDDTYNSSPEAVEFMLEYLSEFPSPRFAVLSDMLELGSMANALHYRLGNMASLLDGLYLTGEYASVVARGAVDGGMGESKVRILDSAKAAEIADVIAREIKSGTVLLKGSHATGLSDVVKILCERKKK